jgi:hypothetical protein
LWKTRQAAQDAILALGPPAMSVLESLRPDASPETSQRIDVILNQLTDELDRATTPSPPSSSSAAPQNGALLPQ